MSHIAVRPKRITIGPADDGRAMSLADFEFAAVKEGCLYELSRGIITVSDVPTSTVHLLMILAVRNALIMYQSANLDALYAVLSGSECKLLVSDWESERHPDLAIYKSAPPSGKRIVWRTWIPEIAIEIVSRHSAKRDYQEKREEYLALGIREYWIFDPATREMLVLRRWRGQWRETTLSDTDVYESRLLPGFRLELANVFSADASE